MVLGSITYQNLNGGDLRELIKQVINDGSVNDQLNDILQNYTIGAVNREDIEYVVTTLAEKTFTSNGVDLTPIIDYIEKLAWVKNEDINKQNLLNVLETQLPDTNLYNQIDQAQSEQAILDEKVALTTTKMEEITAIVMSEDLSSTLPEVIDEIVTYINTETGLNYGLDSVKTGLADKTDKEININNLCFAMETILTQGDFSAQVVFGKVLEEKWDLAIADHGQSLITDDENNTLKYKFISKLIDENGDNKYADYNESALLDKFLLAISESISYLSLSNVTTEEWATNIATSVFNYTMEVDLEYFYNGDDFRDEYGEFIYKDELCAAVNEVGPDEMSESEVTEAIQKFMDNLDVKVKYDEGIILTNVLAKLDALELAPASVGDDLVIDITPMEYNLGSANVESMGVNIVVSDDKPDYIVQTSEDSITIDSKQIMQQVNASDTNIKANIVKPNFRVSVFGGSSIEFEEEDAWKVLTNDGKNFKWEYVETFFKEGVGLLKSVDMLEDRDAIPERYLSVGMIVYVKSSGVYYTLLSVDPKVWDVFKKNDLTKVTTQRPVVYKNVKLGHGDTGTDLKIDKIKTKLIDTLGEELPLTNYLEGIEPNLISFKNVGFIQATINIDGGTLVVNPNSVYETPYDFTMDIKLNGRFNFVGAIITFEQLSEEAITACELDVSGDYPTSIVSPYF